MQRRLQNDKAAAGAMKAMYALQRYVEECGLERSLLEFVKIRASQINGCAYCINMRTKDARALGESSGSMGLLFYTEWERAALAWTEAIMLISQGHAPDEVFNSRKQS